MNANQGLEEVAIRKLPGLGIERANGDCLGEGSANFLFALALDPLEHRRGIALRQRRDGIADDRTVERVAVRRRGGRQHEQDRSEEKCLAVDLHGGLSVSGRSHEAAPAVVGGSAV